MAADPMPAGAPAAEHVSVKCEFCDCRLTRRGQVLEMSPKAKDLRRLEDAIDKHAHTIEEQAAEIARLSSELAAAKASVRQEPEPDSDDDDYFGG